jgi:hypothetical protein
MAGRMPTDTMRPRAMESLQSFTYELVIEHEA